MNQKRATSVWFTDSQRAKLRQLAEALGTSHNATLGMLVDNAQIVLVPRQEAAATLQGIKNGDSASDLRNRSAITVGA